MCDWWSELLRQREDDGVRDADLRSPDIPYPGSSDPQDEAENEAYMRGFKRRRKAIERQTGRSLFEDEG